MAVLPDPRPGTKRERNGNESGTMLRQKLKASPKSLILLMLPSVMLSLVAYMMPNECQHFKIRRILLAAMHIINDP